VYRTATVMYSTKPLPRRPYRHSDEIVWLCLGYPIGRPSGRWQPVRLLSRGTDSRSGSGSIASAAHSAGAAHPCVASMRHLRYVLAVRGPVPAPPDLRRDIAPITYIMLSNPLIHDGTGLVSTTAAAVPSRSTGAGPWPGMLSSQNGLPWSGSRRCWPRSSPCPVRGQRKILRVLRASQTRRVCTNGPGRRPRR